MGLNGAWTGNRATVVCGASESAIWSWGSVCLESQLENGRLAGYWGTAYTGRPGGVWWRGGGPARREGERP